MLNWIKNLFSKKKLACNHSYVKFSTGTKYKYICRHCQDTVRFNYTPECDEFEFKQMLLDRPVKTYGTYKADYYRDKGLL
jgi:hypothetical protein